MGTQHSLSIHTTLPLFYRREQKIYLKVPGLLRSPHPLPSLLRPPGNPKRSRVSALAPMVNVSHCGKVRWGALVAYPVGIGTSSSGKSSTLLGLCLDASTPFWSNTPLWAWEITALDSHSNSEIHHRGQRRRRGLAGAAACCRSSEQARADEFDSVVSRVLA